MFKPLVTIAKADVPRLLVDLQKMSVRELAARYRELYGEPSRSNNKGYLVRRLAWRTQELAEGGLPPSVIQRLKDLGDQLPERWRRRMAERQGVLVNLEALPAPRDPRLPDVGTTLRRVFRGKTYVVKVLAEWFELDGVVHKSLSAVSKAITGHDYNGFQFFKLTKKQGAA